MPLIGRPWASRERRAEAAQSQAADKTRQTTLTTLAAMECLSANLVAIWCKCCFNPPAPAATPSATHLAFPPLVVRCRRVTSSIGPTPFSRRHYDRLQLESGGGKGKGKKESGQAGQRATRADATMRFLKTVLLSLLTFAQIALCAEDYYKVCDPGLAQLVHPTPTDSTTHRSSGSTRTPTTSRSSRPTDN